MHNQQETSHADAAESVPFYRNAAFKATAFAHGVFAAGGLGAQTSDGTASVVQLEGATLIGEEAPELSSPKFTAPLRDTPRTINVIPESVIDQQQAISLRDALRNSPGITFQAGEGGFNSGDNLFIRGFSAEGDIFVDGVRDASQYSRDVYNLEQIEVSKGPSSSTTGRGSTGGSVNMVTKKAFVGEQTQASLALGTDEYKRATIDYNTTLDAATGSAFRVNAMWTDLEVPGRDGVTKSSWAVNPTFGRNLGESLRLTVGYERLEQDNLPDNGLWRDAANDGNFDWTRFYGLYERDYEKVESDRLFAEASATLSNGLTLRNYTQWSQSSLDFAVTSPRVTTIDDVTVATYRDLKQKDREFSTLSNDLNLSGSFGNDQLDHHFSTGLELAREEYTNFARFHEGTAPTAPLYDPNPYLEYEYTIGRTGAYTDAEADTVALYAFDTVSFGERWDLNAGLRWERFDVTQRSFDADGVLTDTLSRADDMFSYNAGLVFKPRENGSVYLGYGTSFSPSAEDLTLSESGRGGPSANHPDLPPEETRNLELGSKWELANGRLALSGALFRTEKTNARTRSSSADMYLLDGKQTIEGIELGVSGMITERWSAFGGVSILDSSIDSSLNPDEDGHELPYAPSKSFNFWTSYQATKRLLFGAGAQYSGDYYYSSTADASTIPPQLDFWLVDLMASFNVNENLDLRLNVKNATDEVYIERGYGGHFVPGASRSFILAADCRF